MLVAKNTRNLLGPLFVFFCSVAEGCAARPRVSPVRATVFADVITDVVADDVATPPQNSSARWRCVMERAGLRLSPPAPLGADLGRVFFDEGPHGALLSREQELRAQVQWREGNTALHTSTCAIPLREEGLLERWFHVRSSLALRCSSASCVLWSVDRCERITALEPQSEALVRVVQAPGVLVLRGVQREGTRAWVYRDGVLPQTISAEEHQGIWALHGNGGVLEQRGSTLLIPVLRAPVPLERSACVGPTEGDFLLDETATIASEGGFESALVLRAHYALSLLGGLCLRSLDAEMIALGMRGWLRAEHSEVSFEGRVQWRGIVRDHEGTKTVRCTREGTE